MYITVKYRSNKQKQISLEEFLCMENIFADFEERERNISNTITYERDEISERLRSRLKEVTGLDFNTEYLIFKLNKFNETYSDIINKTDKREYYRSFYIPKRSGGLRKIDAPNEEIDTAIRELKRLFEEVFGVLWHTSAFAYVKGRSTIDAVKRHQSNESKWFGKYDLHDFFGSTTIEFVMKMFSMVYPFSEITKTPEGTDALQKALSICFLNGGLPQGTPISPLITNVMMIPVDFKLCNKLKNYDRQEFVYTRYADDFIISSKYDFDSKKIERLIKKTLREFEAPFSLNDRKMRYGSSSGSNWNLGVMLNKDNEITVGHKKKKQFQAMLANYAMDKKSGGVWDVNDVQVMYGLYSYYHMVEGETIDHIVKHINEKFNVDIHKMIKADLSP